MHPELRQVSAAIDDWSHPLSMTVLHASVMGSKINADEFQIRRRSRSTDLECVLISLANDTSHIYKC
jgi:hypothetical protein